MSFNEDVADPLLLKAGDVLLIPQPRILQVCLESLTHICTIDFAKKVQSILPLQSPLEGGVEVLVSGSGFVSPAYCKFGDVVSEATYVVDDVIVCSTPSQKNPGDFVFSVSDGKGGFVETSMLFHYTGSFSCRNV